MAKRWAACFCILMLALCIICSALGETYPARNIFFDEESISYVAASGGKLYALLGSSLVRIEPDGSLVSLGQIASEGWISALAAHGHHHAGDVGAVHIARQHPAHLLRLEMVVIVREEQPGLLLVADKAVDLLQEVPALHGDAHVGDDRIHFFAVLFGVLQGLLDRLFFKVQLQLDAVAVGKDLIPLLRQQAV